MHAYWQVVGVLVVGVFCGQSKAIWPFDVSANADAELQSNTDKEDKRIAVIGAGAAGSSTAWHLKKFAARSGIATNVTVYERSPYIGGRSTTVNAFNNPSEAVELGASIFVEVNTILKNATDEFGLNPLKAGSDIDSEFLGIWNGESFVFMQQESGGSWWNTVKILWRYGLAPLRTQRLVKSASTKFFKLYEPPFFPFRSLSDKALDLDLISITSVTGEQYLTANKIGPPFSTDIIQASTRVNYGQNLGLIHGLETMVCMTEGDAMHVEGGNWKIFDSMLRASNATILLNHTVTGLSKHMGKYILRTSFQDPTSGAIYTNKDLYDTVVLAAPLQYSDIEIEKNLLKHVPNEIPYVTLHVTLFTSPRTLNPIYFNLTPDATVPNVVLTTLPPSEEPGNREDGVGKAGFFSISTLRSIVNPKSMEKEYLYKIMSPQKLTSDFLSDILGIPIPTDLSTIDTDSGDAISWYYPHVWQSYPYEYPRVTFEDPELARGFYYTSGIESFISTMETSALMGMNVAQLIVDDFLEVYGKEEGEHIANQILFSEKIQGGGTVDEL